MGLLNFLILLFPGQKAFTGYFGSQNQDLWKENDATELIKGYDGKLNVLIDVGTADKFYKQGQLLPENLDETAQHIQIKGPHYKLRFQEVSLFISKGKGKKSDGKCPARIQGYDHSYYFISTFAEGHINYHAQFLGV